MTLGPEATVRKPLTLGPEATVEIPIAVTPRTRTPVIGTNMLMAPRWLRRHWIASMTRRSLFNFELHAIDLCDAVKDDLPAELVARQPDLRVPLADKVHILSETLQQISAAGFQFEALRDYANVTANQ